MPKFQRFSISVFQRLKGRPLLCIRYGSISSPMFLTHLECTNCGTRHEWRELQNLCTKCQKPLFPVYDLAAVGKKLKKEELAAREKSLWRFREVLPLPMEVEPVTLGEGGCDVSTLKEPYRVEGKKTLGYELAEQMDWTLPDVVLYPTGGGTGLIGMWKAFDEMEQLGWIGRERPRMFTVQASGCAPIVRAFEEGKEHAERWEDAHTVAAGIRVPRAVGDFLILRAVRESGGFAIAVDDDAISAGLDEVAREEGFLMCPEGAATYAAYKQSLAASRIRLA